MPDKFQHKYRISSARLQHWDYGSDALYFVTICTQNREHYFGEITDGKMHLSETGKMAYRFWFEIPIHFPFVHLGEFVVMPNHVHGIIIIDKTTHLGNHDFVESIVDGVIGGVGDSAIVETPKLGVSTIPPTTNETTKTTAASAKWKPGILGSIVNQYKRICTIHARKINPGFSWQPRFHDHIIRNHESYQRISDYINHNPEYWRNDQFF